MNNSGMMLSLVLYGRSTCSHRFLLIKTQEETKPLSAFRDEPYGSVQASSQGRVPSKPLGTIQGQNKVIKLHWISSREEGPGVNEQVRDREGKTKNKKKQTLNFSVFYLQLVTLGVSNTTQGIRQLSLWYSVSIF